jgi:hypothetical protein
MAGEEARERLDVEVAIRASAKEVAPPQSRHAPELERLIGPAPRKPVSPIRIDPDFARFLRDEDSEAEEEDQEQGMNLDGLEARFFPTPSRKVIREKRSIVDAREEEDDMNWHKTTRELVHNAARARPKGTWTTYEDKQLVYKVSRHIVEIDNSIGVEKPSKGPESQSQSGR